jgi:type II restriction enzyme
VIYLPPVNLSMPAEVADAYKSGSQRTRVVTEEWGGDNLYCPNCSSPQLERLPHNTRASDFSCPVCRHHYQLKAQKRKTGKRITFASYKAVVAAILSDLAPSYYFLHYELPDWIVRNLLLIPYFAVPQTAIVERKPLPVGRKRQGWVGCYFVLDMIPIDARIDVVREQVITPPDIVRERYRKVRDLVQSPKAELGWTMEVLSIVRRLTKIEFGNDDIYAYERELERLHPDNRHIRDKIRQQLQVLRDLGFLVHLGRNRWKAV